MRYAIVDQIRGIAIVLMIIFHFNYDLRLFNLSPTANDQKWFWWGLPRIIVFLFLFSMGISLCLAHSKGIRWKKFNKRLAQIVLGAIAISVTTYFLYPKNWVYFGTLHCIAVTSLMALPLLKYPKTSLALSILIVIPILFGLKYPWIILGHKSMDYIPAIPWISVVLLGVYIHSLRLHERIKLPDFKVFSPLKYLGEHSLIIYLIHQPILFGLAWLIHQVLK